ncbi:MAG: hypothetical protein WKF97_02865 [Chitinophagaceae bacterium]
MKTYKLAFGIVSTLAISVIIYQVRKTKVEKRRITISDAGYETAYDVLYPVKTKRFRRHL